MSIKVKKGVRKLNRFISRRFSGEISDRIKCLKSKLNDVDRILQSSLVDNFWVLWFIENQKSHLKHLKKARFLPESFFSVTIYEKSLEPFKHEGIIDLKGIKLPVPPDRITAAEYFNMLPDNILTYLFGDIEEKLFCSLMDMTMEGPYEYKAVQLEKDDIVIDAGASIGAFSALASAKGCRAYSFEPIGGVIDKYLSKTAEMNPNISVNNYALSDKKDVLYFNTKGLTDSSAVTDRGGDGYIEVQAIDLDSFVEENMIPRVDFIKADIEGAERFMLMGAKRILKEFSPKLAICTYHLPDDPEVLGKIILDANPDYIIENRWKKLYAYVPKTS